MPIEDARRWNKRYRDEPFVSNIGVRPFLLEHSRLLPTHGRSLDIAMGLGANAAFLLDQGLQSFGVDISWTAVSQAKRTWPGLLAAVVDCTCWCFPSVHFDVILNFYYLQRDLWPQFQRILIPGGLVFIETLTTDMLAGRPVLDPKYLLEPGELIQAFADWDVLVYREGWFPSEHGHEKAIASLIARTPGGQAQVN